ncbi:MAG: hypothetical protein U5R30_13610 [Deltaproteobacteria bacterium]|nr:hypothetical protein [Deltaproteobacteria bacterium]
MRSKCEGNDKWLLSSPCVALFNASCTRLSLGWLLPSRACLRFTGQLVCSASGAQFTTRFGTGWAEQFKEQRLVNTRQIALGRGGEQFGGHLVEHAQVIGSYDHPTALSVVLLGIISCTAALSMPEAIPKTEQQTLAGSPPSAKPSS